MQIIYEWYWIESVEAQMTHKFGYIEYFLYLQKLQIIFRMVFSTKGVIIPKATKKFHKRL